MRNKIQVERFPEPRPYNDLHGWVSLPAHGKIHWPSGNNNYIFALEDLDELEKLVEVYETLAAVDEFLSEDADGSHPTLP